MKTRASEEQTLVNLGLTNKQARVYLALAKSEPLRVIEISRIAKIARSDVYPSLKKLQTLSIIEKLIQKPPRYKAVPMTQALASLLEAKTSQYKKLKRETEILQRTAHTEKPKFFQENDTDQFILVPQGKAATERIKSAIENAQHWHDAVLSWKRFSRGVGDLLAESLAKARAKNVMFRFVVEKPPENEKARELIRSFLESQQNQIRFIPYHPDTVCGIYDRKHISVILISDMDIQSSPVLWSNNDALVSLGVNYFECLWNLASES